MISFKKFRAKQPIAEVIDVETIHDAPGISAIKNLTKSSTGKELRYIIDPETGTHYLGDANHMTHYDMVRRLGLKNDEHAGYVRYNDNDKSFSVRNYGGEDIKPEHSRFIKRLKNSGFIHDTKL
jgi:hypothetical protein